MYRDSRRGRRGSSDTSGTWLASYSVGFVHTFPVSPLPRIPVAADKSHTLPWFYHPSNREIFRTPKSRAQTSPSASSRSTRGVRLRNPRSPRLPSCFTCSPQYVLFFFPLLPRWTTKRGMILSYSFFSTFFIFFYFLPTSLRCFLSWFHSSDLRRVGFYGNALSVV